MLDPVSITILVGVVTTVVASITQITLKLLKRVKRSSCCGGHVEVEMKSNSS